MRKILSLSFLLSFVLSFSACGQMQKTIIVAGANVEKLADGFSFTEGPAVDKEGNIYFTDQPNDKIFKWSTEGELSVFMENTGRANGLYFDRNGKLLSCSDMDNELWSIGEDVNHVVLVTDFEGKKLNGPNDLWVDPNGGIYFTDPLYKRDYWTRDPEMQQEGEYVYYLSPDRKNLSKVATDLVKPNGIIGAPDGTLLYIADIGANKTYAYDISEDGSLANKRLFAPLGSDGMTLDEDGNVYLTGKGVKVFNPQGEEIAHIPIDAGWTANVCFGGKDMQTLFITASENLFSLRMNVRGVR